MQIKLRKVRESATLPQCHNGDWIDLYTNYIEVYNSAGYMMYASNVQGDTYTTHRGDTVVMFTGVAMQLPNGYEAHLAPRSSTYQKTGLLQSNSVGIIDNNYCGDNDEWIAKFYATTSGQEVKVGERYLQFRLVEKQPEIEFDVVDSLGNPDRGGFGSTNK